MKPLIQATATRILRSFGPLATYWPQVLESSPRLQDVFQQKNTSTGSGAYQRTVAHRQLSLSSGWNLVSIPVSPLGTVITQTLHHIEGKRDLAYAYFASDADDPWKKYNTAAPPFLNDLTEMGPGWGYWIRVSEDCVWSVP